MGLDQRAGKFEWRKHARLQQFMNKMWHKQNPKSKTEHDLGFNAGDKPVIIDEKVIKELESAIESNYYHFFCHDGFFWGQQWQEEAVKEYKDQDLLFLKHAKKAVKNGEPLQYECWW